jgi:hypothetical protein
MFPEVMLGKGTTSVVSTTHQIFRALTNASSFVQERRFGAAKCFWVAQRFSALRFTRPITEAFSPCPYSRNRAISPYARRNHTRSRRL